MDIIKQAQDVIEKEIIALQKTKESLDKNFETALSLIINCEGRLIITGMGKPGHVAQKIAATFASLGTPAFHLHPAEALHGDLGMVTDRDVVLAISYSGESDEVIRILPTIKLIGALIIAVSGRKESTLVRYSDVALIFPEFEEACHMKLAPTSSTTAAMALGDALAVVASQVYGFQKEDFAKFHPGGALGKKLRFKTQDLMVKGDKIPRVNEKVSLYEAIIELGQKEQGLVAILDDNEKITGIVTDGDLRRMLEKRVDIYNIKVKEVMKSNPICTQADTLAIKVLNNLREFGISGMLVSDSENHLVGIIRLQNIVEAGII